jgi:hypothetical protein
VHTHVDEDAAAALPEHRRRRRRIPLVTVDGENRAQVTRCDLVVQADQVRDESAPVRDLEQQAGAGRGVGARRRLGDGQPARFLA